MPQSFLLLCFLLMCCQAFGTCIVIIRKDNEILIGTDSRHQNMRSTGEVKGTVDNYCKVRKAGDFYYGLVGFDDLNQMKFAESVAKEAKTVEEFARIYADSLSSHYNSLIGFMRDSHPEQYNKMFADDNLVSQTPIFRFENGIARLVVVEIRNFTKPNQQMRMAYMLTNDPPTIILGSFFFRRDQRHIQDLAVIEKRDEVAFIQKAIDYEAEKGPSGVGGPTHIWRFTEKSVNWVNPESTEPDCIR